MKNVTKALSLLIILSFGLFSCKTASVMKRHYNKGYYVSKKHEASEVKSKERISHDKTISTPEQKPSIASIDAPELKNEVELKAELPSETNKAKKEIKESTSPQIANGFSGKNPIKDIIGMPHELKKALKQDDVARDALSLLWILILVLLIVYVIGLILDLFGLGPVFHILGVIVLVLLLLWLLRVI